MNTNTTAAQDSAATQTNVIRLTCLNQSLKKEIEILQECTQTQGTDISNIFEMIDQQLYYAMEKAEELPETEKMDMLKSFWFMDTLLRQVRDKVNGQLFWAINNILYEFKKEVTAQEKAVYQLPSIKSLAPELAILQGCTETHATDTVLMLEMVYEQLENAFSKTEILPLIEKQNIKKTLYYMDTLLRQIRAKVNDKLFWAIDNVVYEFKKEKAA